MLVEGMLGLGDNLHQRAVIRQMMERGEVWLQTPWPTVYHDLIGPRLHVVKRESVLRTQQKNIGREADKFSAERCPSGNPHKIWYTHDQIKQRGGFLAAMCHNSKLPTGDFSLPVPDAWKAKAKAAIGNTDKPIMVYRPLVARTEWNGCNQRNPDAGAYVELARSIRDQFFVVSLADLEQGKEWTVSQPIGADIEFHRGELDFETIAGLMSIASLVYCSPGFALVLAQAVAAPMVAVFGGHESARLYDHGSPTDLFIQPRRPCECFSKSHACDKSIDMDAAKLAVNKFIGIRT
jgi:ADP-heptose:LPS heptosyltransferase